MNSEKLQDAIGEVRDAYIRDADVIPAKKKSAWVKWAAVAACAAIVAAAAGLPFLLQRTGSEADNEYSNPPSQTLRLSLQESFRQYGLSALAIDEPEFITSSETPQITEEEALAHLKQTELILACTVEEISRAIIEDPNSDSTWYITAMTLSADGVIRGEAVEERFRVVNAAVTNEPVEFLSYPGLEACREQMRAAFVLKKLDRSDVWMIGDTTVPASELGTYTVVDCMGYDGDCVWYNGYGIPLTELQ